MPGRCVAGGCSAFPDVEQGLVLHAIPFYNDDRPEARKRRKKWVDFVKQKWAKWEPTRNSSLCSRHFTEDDFIRRFTFAEETSGKPIIPRLKRDELGINVFPTVHAEVVNKTPVLSESAKRRQERQTIKNAKKRIETLTSQSAATCSDVGDDHVEMESDEMSSEVRERSSVDALVENTAIDDTDCSTELNNVAHHCSFAF